MFVRKLSALLVLIVLCVNSSPVRAYSVLTHEQIVDLALVRSHIDSSNACNLLATGVS